MDRYRIALGVGLFVLLSACGGGGGYHSAMTTPIANASPGGIWNGTDSSTGLTVQGLVTETGRFEFIRSDGAQFIGTVNVSNFSLSGTVTGFTPIGTTFADGSTSGTGTLTGSVAARTSMAVIIAFTTSKGTTTTIGLPLLFDPLYNVTSSLATIAGNYTESGTGTAVSVSASGAVFAQEMTTGCVVNGTVSIIDATYNAYDVSYTYANCTGAYTVLNGVTATGLATLDTALSPAQAIIGISGQVPGVGTVGLVETLTKN